MKRVFWISAILILSAILFPIIYGLKNDIQTTAGKSDWCNSLKLGMTKEQVRQILGDPQETGKDLTSHLTEIEWWYYGRDASGSGTISTDFDLQTGLMRGFSCGESFWLSIDDESLVKYGIDSLLVISQYINQLEIGSSADPILKDLGEPINVYDDSGTLVWQYPGIVSADGRPGIYIDPVSNTVKDVKTSLQYFISEEIAMTMLKHRFSMN